jgi:tetratricopeptide (TPR) repeat protein
LVVKLQYLLALIFLVVFGCSSVNYRLGLNALEEGEYAEASEYLGEAVKESPRNAQIWRQLGIAYYKSGNYENAANAFKQATLLDMDDGTSRLYAAMCNEALGDYPLAVSAYQSYILSDGGSPLAESVRVRIRNLRDAGLRAAIGRILEADTSASTIRRNSICIFGIPGADIDPQYAALAHGIADMLSRNLQTWQFTPCNRMIPYMLTDTLGYSSEELSDSSVALYLGKLLGVEAVMTVQIRQPEVGEVGADLTMVKVGDGSFHYASSRSARLDRFYHVEEDLLRDVLLGLNAISPDDVSSMADTIGTRSFLAMLSYSRGLVYADKQMYRLAEAEFEAALAEDPTFSEAAAMIERYGGLGEYRGSVQPLAQFEQKAFTSLMVEKPSGADVRSLLETHSVLGFQPDESDKRESDAPYEFPKVKGKVTVIGTFYPDDGQ